MANYQQNYAFSSAYDQQHQPPTAPYLTQPPLPYQQPVQHQPIITTNVHVQPAAVHVEQQPTRIVYVQKEEDDEELHGCLGLCCVCTACICAILSRLANYLLAFFATVIGLGLAVYFIKYYQQ